MKNLVIRFNEFNLGDLPELTTDSIDTVLATGGEYVTALTYKEAQDLILDTLGDRFEAGRFGDSYSVIYDVEA